MQLSYRLGNWRNGFATAAAESVKTMIKDNTEYLSTEDAIQEYINFSLEEVPVHRNTTRADLDDEQTIKPLMTASFHWREWNDGKKKKVSTDTSRDMMLISVSQGFLQHQLILRTFALAHLAGLEDIDERTDDKPIGALILSMQAVSPSFSFKLVVDSLSSVSGRPGTQTPEDGNFG